MGHSNHAGLISFDQRQILCDGCSECAARSEHPELAIELMDEETFARAWKRAFDLWSGEGDREALGLMSEAEQPLLHVLWAVQAQFARAGLQMNGELESAESRLMRLQRRYSDLHNAWLRADTEDEKFRLTLEASEVNQQIRMLQEKEKRIS